MASLQERRNKAGKLVSYSIRIFTGRGPDGRQLKPHCETFRVQPGWTEAYAKRQAQAHAAVLEGKLKEGRVAISGKTTFGEYYQHVLQTRTDAGELRPTTVQAWTSAARYFLPVLGATRLKDITTATLNSMFAALASTRHPDQARLKVDLGLPRGAGAQLAEKTGLARSTVYKALRGESVSTSIAETIAAGLDAKTGDLFEVLPGEPLGTPTIDAVFGTISAVFSFAEREGLLPDNPVKRAVRPKRSDPEADVLQPEEVTAMLRASSEEPLWFQVALHVLAYSGCRKGELLGLQVGDLLPDGIRITHTLVQVPGQPPELGPTKTAKSKRIVALPPHVLDLVHRYLDAEGRTEGFILMLNGKPLQRGKLNYELDRFTDRHGFRKVHPHTIRHSAASALIASGQTDLVSVSRQLGHSKTATTADIYSHVIEQSRTRSASILSDAFGGV